MKEWYTKQIKNMYVNSNDDQVLFFSNSSTHTKVLHQDFTLDCCVKLIQIIPFTIFYYICVGYSIEYSGVVTLREYSNVYGGVVKLGVKERTSSPVDICTSPGSEKKDFEEYRCTFGLSAFIQL